MASPVTENNSFEAFLAKPRGDKHIRLNISRNTLIAFLVSIALHVLLLLLVLPKINLNSAPQSTTIEVNLVPKTTTPGATPSPIIPEEKPTPELEPKKKVIAQKPISKPNKPKASDFSVPKTMTTPQPSPQQVPTRPVKPQPQSPSDAPTDMASYVAQQRAKREASESDAARQNAAAVAAEQGPSEEAKRDDRIKKNFNNGTNGIFEITDLNLGSNSARFSFLGWTSSVSNAHRDFFEVEAKNGQDVRLILIRRMIAIIRQHYQGDFDWESQRLHRTISKSARLEDSAELEDFLMQEFFGTNYKTKQ